MLNINKLKDEKGQTLVEYMLLLVVIVALCIGVFGRLEGYLFSDPDSLFSQFKSQYQSMFEGGNGSFQGQYKRFTIKR